MRFARILPLALALAAHSPALADRVGANASQHPRVGTLAELSFATGSDQLPIGSERELGEIAAWAKANPDGHIVLEGHADHAGPASANLDLSVRRAEAVRLRLLTLGVVADQVIVAGYGEQGADTGRRVVVWTSRSSVDAIEALIRARGAKRVKESPLIVRH